MYGSTETWWLAFATVEDALKGYDLKSNGFVTPCTEIKIADPESGEVLGKNKRGEILVKGALSNWLIELLHSISLGPLVLPGYLNNEEANRNSFDEEGFFRTGDCGYYDDEGRVYIVDRFKEIIKCDGVVVPPVELEFIIRTHPAVSDVAVVGVPHPVHSEVPRAFVVLHEGKTATEDELKEFVKGQVAYWKELRGGVRFLKALPLLPLGKVDRKALKQMQ